MRYSRILLSLAFLQIVLSGCSRAEEMSTRKVSETRAVVLLSQGKFRAMATVLSHSTVAWANAESVRYRSTGGDYRTDSWRVADLDGVIRREVSEFIVEHRVVAVYVGDSRVNFVLSGQGIAPSGISIGLLVITSPSAGCTEIVNAIELERNGLQCESFGDSTYFYLQR